ncbi:MAG: 5-(carboxyamino)imidazole ribonucleotide synthase [Deltaproteobacteria bacterium]|nr:5-(carboxyamino)imidazole ribonucleotide synthase [Deltaproteobacteria bacterium]
MTSVGIFGAGQLGRMLALAGYPLGLRFRFFDPQASPPAAALGTHVRADYDDLDAVARFAGGVDVVTFEFEDVPLAAVGAAADRVPVHPAPPVLAALQDRWDERQLLRRVGLPFAPCAPAAAAAEVSAALDQVGLPAVIKRRRSGYDGRGQRVVRSRAAALRAWHELGAAPVIVEALQRFRRELSIIGVRGRDGAVRIYPLAENHHHRGILRRSLAPAAAGAVLQATARRYVRRLLQALDYVGALTVELFEVDGGLLVNELAPRVHNSGHWTIEGAETSQFENHLRAVLGLPLGDTRPRGAAAMVNLIGAPPALPAVLGVDGVHLHLYDKPARPQRKLGHVTVYAADRRRLVPRLAAVERLIGGPPGRRTLHP